MRTGYPWEDEPSTDLAGVLVLLGVVLVFGAWHVVSEGGFEAMRAKSEAILDAPRTRFMEMCLQHEPQYQCEYKWEIMR